MHCECILWQYNMKYNVMNIMYMDHITSAQVFMDKFHDDASSSNFLDCMFHAAFVYVLHLRQIGNLTEWDPKLRPKPQPIGCTSLQFAVDTRNFRIFHLKRKHSK